MVILGGLEIVAAGYIIHKHQQNKREKQRIADEAAALSESQYRIFPPNRPASSSGHRRRRSHSRESSGRHSHERRDRHDRTHSEDGKYTHGSSPPRRDDGRPAKAPVVVPLPQQQPPMPVYHTQTPVAPITQFAPPPQQAQTSHLPPPAYHAGPTATYTPPQDMKYGWTDQQAHAPQPAHDPTMPPTGWPAEWAQSQNPPASTSQSGSSGRHGRRHRTPEPNSSRVRFDLPRDGGSRSPPPSYRG